MANYTLTSVGSYTIDTPYPQESSSTQLGPGSGITQSDNKAVYYASVTFLYQGTATLRFSAYSPATGGTIPLSGQAAVPTAVFNYDTGDVNPAIARGTAYVSTWGSDFGDALTIDVAAGSTYYFYFNLGSSLINSVVFFPYIYYQRYSGPTWGYEYDDTLGKINTTLTKTISSSQQSEYKLYCFRIRSDLYDGNIVIQSNGAMPTQMYLTDTANESVFDHRTGEIYSRYLFQGNSHAEGPDGKISVAIGNATAYFWIRHDSGSTTSELSFTIYPPGAAWSALQIEDTWVGQSGKSFSYNAGRIAQKTVDYMVLTFGTATTFQFQAVGTDRMYTYLTRSIDIDSNGYPSESSILARDTGSSTGFTLSYAVNTSDTYYLMFRTYNGDANTGSFTVSILTSGLPYYYDRMEDELSIAGTRDIVVRLSEYSGYYVSKYFLTRYAASGTVRVSIDHDEMRNLVVYMVPGRDYGYNEVSGAPYRNSSHEEAGGGSVLTFDVVAGEDYYIWARATPPDVTGNPIVTIQWTQKQWTYPAYSDLYNLERVTSTQSLPLSEKTGAMFSCSFRYSGEASMIVQGMSSAIIYVTEGNYGFNSNGVPYANLARTRLATGGTSQTIPQTLLGQAYYVWVSPGNGSVSGNAVVTITPPTVTVEWQLDDRTSDSSTRNLNVNLENKWISLSRAHTAEYLVSFTRSGTAKFRSYGSVEVSVYFGDSGSTISASDGIPADSDASDIGDPDFYLEVEVAAGTTYHIWIKGNDEFVEGGTYLTIVVPENVSTTRGYWIWVNVSGSTYEWVKLTPYVGNMSRVWQEYKGYVATSEGWPDQY